MTKWIRVYEKQPEEGYHVVWTLRSGYPEYKGGWETTYYNRDTNKWDDMTE